METGDNKTLPGIFGGVPGFLKVFRIFLSCSGPVADFLEGVPGCSGFSKRCSGVFRVSDTVPGVTGYSGVPVFRVPVFLDLLHADTTVDN